MNVQNCPAGIPPFTADIGIVGQRIVRTVDGQRALLMRTRIEEFGDLSTFGAMEVIDAEGLVVTPHFAAKVGDVVRLPPEGRERKDAAIGPGQAANMVLLRPQADGRYRVERVFVNEAGN